MTEFFASYASWKNNIIEKTGVFGQSIFVIIRIILIYMLGRFLYAFIKSTIKRTVIHSNKLFKKEGDSKSETIGQIITGVFKYVIYVLVVIEILEQIGLKSTVNSIITAAGIGGLALGLGLQNLLTDVCSGIFLLFDNQFAIGDVVEILGFKGTVVHTTLRTTVLRCPLGETVTIPNGKITTVKNFSTDKYTAIVKAYVSPDAELIKAKQIMTQVTNEYLPTYENAITKEVSAIVTDVKPGIVTLAVIIQVKPETQYALTNDLNEKILLAFKNADIKLATGDSRFNFS